MTEQERLTPERLAELRRIAEAATPGPWSMHSEPEFSGPWSVGADHLRTDSTVATAWAIEWSAEAAQANAQHIAAFDPTTCLALLDRIEELEADTKKLERENGELYSRIERLEAKLARQRVALRRLQVAVERRNSDERIEAMRRALYDETVDRYMREYDAAADEAERWRKKYEALLSRVAALADEIGESAREAWRQWDADADRGQWGRAMGLEQAEQMVRRVLSEAGGGSQ